MLCSRNACVNFHTGIRAFEGNLVHHRSDDENTASSFLEQIILIERIRQLFRDESIPFIAHYELENVGVAVARDVYKFGGIALIAVEDAVVDNLRNGNHHPVEYRFSKTYGIVQVKEKSLDQFDVRRNAWYAD